MRRGAPRTLLCDNGLEFTSQVADLWTYHPKVELAFTRSGKPMDNAFVESFNGTLRDEGLNAHWFTSLTDAKEQIEQCRMEYNESRPHGALGEMSPAEYVRQLNLRPQLTDQRRRLTLPFALETGAAQTRAFLGANLPSERMQEFKIAC